MQYMIKNQKMEIINKNTKKLFFKNKKIVFQKGCAIKNYH